MKSALSLLALEALTVAAQKVVPFELRKRDVVSSRSSKSKRATVTEPLGNAGSLYYANVTVGTPGQLVQLQIDTGSSDVWMTDHNARFCRNQDNCVGGTFNPKSSSTFHEVAPGGFNITYVDGSSSVGDFISDDLEIGGVTLNNLQMGLALSTSIGTGIIGVGYADDESVCNHEDPCQEYPSITQTLVNQSKINSQAYSLWLNDLNANTGSLLFGGIDAGKYSGPLVTLPVQTDAESGAFTSFSVAWTGFNIGTPKGEETNFVPQNFAEAAILDSGTSDLIFPDDLANQLFNQFGAQYDDRDQTWLAPCYLSTANATLDFQFGGSNGPIIKVSVSEFLMDLGTDGSGKPFKFHSTGQVACELGFEAAQGRPILLGDTFLRSAYVVYDLDNNEVSIAQTNFNSGQQNVLEIQAGPRGVPSVASTASMASISQTATGVQTVQTAGIGGSPTQDLGSVASSLVAGTGAPPLAAFTTAQYTGPTGEGSAAGLQVPLADFEGLAVCALMMAFAIVGSGMVLL